MERQQSQKLLRSKTDRILGGVCAGIARYFRVDPTLIRIIFVVIALGGGFGVGLYLIMWIVIPEEGATGQSTEERMKNFGEEVKTSANQFANDMRTGGPSNRRTLLALIIILIGVGLLINQFLAIHWFRWDVFWPVLIIAVGVAIILKRYN